VASSHMSVTIGRQARQKVGPSDWRAERMGTTQFIKIILKLKERFGHLQRPVKFRVPKNSDLKEEHKTWKPYTKLTYVLSGHKLNTFRYIYTVCTLCKDTDKRQTDT